MNILIVDDTSETRDLFQLCFVSEGHTAETAHNGQEALRIVEESGKSLDVIIMDYHMWGMTGLEVVRKIRKMKNLTPIPVILYTADPNEKVEREAQKLGVDCVVQKPALPNHMIAIAEELVKGT
jgi:CheY-like chemotaxis protein